MKVLLFTHKDDSDGLGCAVLGKLAFSDFTYELCNISETDPRVEMYLNNGDIYKYDKIYITDLSLKDNKLLSRIDSDVKLTGKIMTLDHHLSEVGKHPYDWINTVVENEKGLCSATSLFYDYLIKNNYLAYKPIIEQFQEETRRLDTWEWVKLNDKTARKLAIMKDILGVDHYISTMIDKLSNNDVFNFTGIEENLINIEQEKINSYVDSAIEHMIIRTDDNYKVGYIFAESHNSITAEELRNRGIDLDYVTFIGGFKQSISYRNVKPDFDVSAIAKKRGGGGHKFAAGSPITEEQLNRMIDIIIK